MKIILVAVAFSLSFSLMAQDESFEVDEEFYDGLEKDFPEVDVVVFSDKNLKERTTQDLSNPQTPEEIAKRIRIDSLMSLMKQRMEDNGGVLKMQTDFQERERRRHEQESKKRPWQVLRIVLLVVTIGGIIIRKASK
ncbi:MAG: hypothetical protein COA58_04805 [Bacteroidetes bacterium]|nr:MAG: hypothetical protein COA58_04805 [Bacteroidota bacterium]